MAKTLQITTSTIYLLLTIAIAIADNKYTFSSQISPNKLGLKHEKLSHFHFYFHEHVKRHDNGSYSAVNVNMGRAKMTKPFFGRLVVMDDPLTLGPSMSSKLVGRAQGIYCYASQAEIDLIVATSFVFTEGKYNGSTLSLLGRIPVHLGVREMPIVGGSGLFRFARGYIRGRYLRFIKKTTVVEYNAFVFHY